MKTTILLYLALQFLLSITIMGCDNPDENKTGIPPEILSVEWKEISDTTNTVKVIEEKILNFQSANLSNSRTIRVLVPDYYSADSVRVFLTIKTDAKESGILALFYEIDDEDYQLLPENSCIIVANGEHKLSLYAMDSLDQKSDVFSVPEFNINTTYKVLYANDGQDFSALKFKKILEELYTSDTIEKIIVVGIDASADRLNEYGTIDSLENTVICASSIGNIGTKAKEYTKFVAEEVIPFINLHYRVKTGPENNSIMGSSLGGLSAFNIAWMKPELVGKAGAFSGSFWWREYAGENPTGEEINQARIMQKLVKNSIKRNGMKFWFEAGTNDETSDRDNDGIIDAIDDTKDLISELVILGYIENQDFVYIQVEGGQHNQATWSQVLDDFLLWNYSK